MLADVLFPDTVGGAGRVLYNLSHELQQKGHEVHIITRNTSGDFPYYEKLNSNLFVHRFFAPQKESLALLISEIKESYLLSKKLSQKVFFDLICVHQSLAAIGPLLSGVLKGIPIIHYFYSPWHEEFYIKKQQGNEKSNKKIGTIVFIMRWLERLILSKAAIVIVMSDYMFKKVVEIHNYPKRKMVTIPGGVDLCCFNLPQEGKIAAKNIVRPPVDKTVFLSVRNLVPRMGLEELISAFNHSEILRRKAMLMVGGKGFSENHLKSMVENFHLQNSIRFLGHIPDDDLPGIYQAADFFVLPTRKLEGFGLVILEAMACGTPVLGTPVGAIPEVIGPFDKKLLFDGTSWLDIKKKLEDVIKRPEKYRFDSKACRKFVENNFSWKKMADSFENEIIKLIRR